MPRRLVGSRGETIQLLDVAEKRQSPELLWEGKVDGSPTGVLAAGGKVDGRPAIELTFTSTRGEPLLCGIEVTQVK